MMITLKLWCLAFNIHDGHHHELAERRGMKALAEYRIQKLPGLLEFYG